MSYHSSVRNVGRLVFFAFYTHEKCMPFDYTQLCWASPKMDNYLYSSYIPYSLDQTLLLLLISSPDFVQRHSRVATNREWRSFISVNSSLVPRQLSRFQCTGIRSLADIEDKDELQRRTNLFLMTANCILSTWALQATSHSRYYYAILCIAIESQGLSTCTCTTWIVAVATTV